MGARFASQLPKFIRGRPDSRSSSRFLSLLPCDRQRGRFCCYAWHKLCPDRCFGADAPCYSSSSGPRAGSDVGCHGKSLDFVLQSFATLGPSLPLFFPVMGINDVRSDDCRPSLRRSTITDDVSIADAECAPSIVYFSVEENSKLQDGRILCPPIRRLRCVWLCFRVHFFELEDSVTRLLSAQGRFNVLRFLLVWEKHFLRRRCVWLVVAFFIVHMFPVQPAWPHCGDACPAVSKSSTPIHGLDGLS